MTGWVFGGWARRHWDCGGTVLVGSDWVLLGAPGRSPVGQGSRDTAAAGTRGLEMVFATASAVTAVGGGQDGRPRSRLRVMTLLGTARTVGSGLPLATSGLWQEEWRRGEAAKKTGQPRSGRGTARGTAWAQQSCWRPRCVPCATQHTAGTSSDLLSGRPVLEEHLSLSLNNLEEALSLCVHVPLTERRDCHAATRQGKAIERTLARSKGGAVKCRGIREALNTHFSSVGWRARRTL